MNIDYDALKECVIQQWGYNQQGYLRSAALALLDYIVKTHLPTPGKGMKPLEYIKHRQTDTNEFSFIPEGLNGTVAKLMGDWASIQMKEQELSLQEYIQFLEGQIYQLIEKYEPETAKGIEAKKTLWNAGRKVRKADASELP